MTELDTLVIGEGPAGVDPAARETAERHRSAAVDSLRALAALSVLAFHAAGIPNAPPPSGEVAAAFVVSLDDGLVLFFVISGYLISGPFVRALLEDRELPDTRRYALRRLCRILPAFWVALAVVALLPSQTANGAQPPTAWWQVPVHGLLLGNVVPGQLNTMLKVDWTLENELLYYLLVPLAAWAVVRAHRGVTADRLSALVAAVWALSAVYVFGVDQLPLFTNGSAVARYTLPAVVGLFCPGILVGIALTPAGRRAGGIPGAINALLTRRAVAAGVGVALLALSVLLTGVALHLTRPIVIDVRWQPAAAAFGVALGLAATSGARLNGVTRLLAPVGLISYGIYLWHTLVIHVVTSAGLVVSSAGWGRLAWPVNALTILAITAVPATASWLWIERPALRWASRTATEASERPAAVVVRP